VTGYHRIPFGEVGRGTLDAYVLGMTLSGRAISYYGKQKFYSDAGVIGMVVPGTPQHWQVVGTPEDPRGEWFVVYAVFQPRPHWHEWLRYPEAARGYMRLVIEDARIHRRVRHGLIQMHRLVNSAWPERIDMGLAELERVLLWCHAAEARRASPMDPRIRQAIDILSTRLAERLTLADLAGACHASRSHLAELFHRQVGVPPMEFLEQQRVARAMQMLRLTTEPLKAIAAATGFCDAKYFAKRFRRRAGVTPRAYRKRFAG
jgi:AraC family transcriptional regulator, arabinose operon regulatory protein